MAGLGDSLRQVGSTLLEMAHTRLCLVATEIEAEKRQWLAVMAWTAFGVLMATVSLVCLAALLTLLCWDTHRLWVLGGLVLAFGALGGLALWQVRRRLRASGGLLHDTLAELEADGRALCRLPGGAA